MSEAMNEWCGPETAVGLDSVTAFFSVNICKVIIIIHGNPIIREHCTSLSVLKTQFLLLQNVIGLKFLFFNLILFILVLCLSWGLIHSDFTWYLIQRLTNSPYLNQQKQTGGKRPSGSFHGDGRKGRKLPPHPLYTLTPVSLLHTLTRVPLLRITSHDRSSPGQGNDL